MRSTTMRMGTITVRLDADDERLLDELAKTHGDRSTAVREAIRLLSGEERRKRSFSELIELIEREDGPIDQELVDEYTRRWNL